MGNVHTSTGDLREPAGRSQGRLEWADAAKGACILLVVLWHVIMKNYLKVDWNIPVPFPGAWGTAGELLLPLRMPFFFAISGFFAVNAIGRSWPVILRSKTAFFYYVYVVWLAIHTLVFSFTPNFDTAIARNPMDFLGQLTITPSNLWYIFALGLYFVVAKLLHRVPQPVVLAAAFVLSAVSSAELVAVPGDRGGVYENLLFFLIGLYGKTIVGRVAGSASWLRFFGVAVPYLGILVVINRFGAETWFGVWPVVCLLAVFVGVTLASLVTRWAMLTKGLVGIGRQTLPIYVMHMPLLALLHAAIVGPISYAGPAVQLVLAAVWPVVLTAVVTAICVVLHRLLPSKWLFEPPWASRPRARESSKAEA